MERIDETITRLVEDGEDFDIDPGTVPPKKRMKIGPGAVLYDAVLYGADLHDADLRNAYLRNADLRGADLRGAKVPFRNREEAEETCWSIEDVNWDGVIWKE